MIDYLNNYNNNFKQKLIGLLLIKNNKEYCEIGIIYKFLSNSLNDYHDFISLERILNNELNLRKNGNKFLYDWEWILLFIQIGFKLDNIHRLSIILNTIHINSLLFFWDKNYGFFNPQFLNLTNSQFISIIFK